MSKIYIRTKDVFNIYDANFNQKCLNYCYEKALKYGILCGKTYNKKHWVLELAGPKHQVVKYYFVTMLKTTNKINGIKRLISVIF